MARGLRSLPLSVRRTEKGKRPRGKRPLSSKSAERWKRWLDGSGSPKKKVVNRSHLMLSHFAKVQGWKASSETTLLPCGSCQTSHCSANTVHEVHSPGLTWNDLLPGEPLTLSEESLFLGGSRARLFRVKCLGGRRPGYKL